MKIGKQHYRTIWEDPDDHGVKIIDQTKLPFTLEIASMEKMTDACQAISNMLVRGAPLVGATAAYGVALAMKDDPSDGNLEYASAELFNARPTAVNLGWAIKRLNRVLKPLAPEDRKVVAFQEARTICDEDVQICDSIGEHGLSLIKDIAILKESEPINILTHCNAGWLATVDWGTALAPVYKAHDAGIDVHVWVDETRPRNQGSYLTAFELGQHGIPHTVISDNSGGHLMQHNLVDVCFVGTDRTSASGDVCNKIGTYLKALAASDNNVPFYVCAPSPSIDFEIDNGLRDIPIEQRDPNEVNHVTGKILEGAKAGTVTTVSTLPDGSTARNDAFDVTPAKYITKLITEKGPVDADKSAIATLLQ